VSGLLRKREVERSGKLKLTLDSLNGGGSGLGDRGAVYMIKKSDQYRDSAEAAEIAVKLMASGSNPRVRKRKKRGGRSGSRHRRLRFTCL